MPMLRALLLLQLATQAQPVSHGASTLIDRARAARYQQDSSLAAYEAIAKQRMTGSIGLAPGLRGGLPAVGRMRLAARFESVARVGWDHALGAWAEIIASRAVVPFIGMREPQPETDDAALTLPYYPGRDRLWPMTELRDAMRATLHRDRAWVEHPLDAGSDSVYQLTLGDSIAFRLPDASVIQLREIRLRPRRPDQRLVVGSLWVDIASGALVRAAYRPSMPMDLWPFFEHQLDAEDRNDARKFGPFTGNIQEIVVEHALYEGRFWLPRTRLAVGEGTARGARVTISIEQSFRYQRVAALPAGVFAQAPATADSALAEPGWGSTWHGVQRRTQACRSATDAPERWSADSLLRDSSVSVMYAEGVRFHVVLPCDTSALLTSKELPASIYSKSEELFTEVDFGALQRDADAALRMSRQADWDPQRAKVYVGVDRGLLRYNRVEGLAGGAFAERVLGKGYTERARVQLGVADLVPTGELTLERSNGRFTLDAAAYRRLAYANDWGNPLGLGASLTALVFGRDEGLFYRTLGVEARGSRQEVDSPLSFAWRLFAERQDSASVETQFSVAHAMNGVRFMPNIPTREGVYAGGAVGLTLSTGVDPRGARASGTLRLEGAGGETSFGRGLLEATTSIALGRSRRVTLTTSAGSSVGDVPFQRLFYLGGPESVHGHAPGDLAGDAFWLGRFEMTQGHTLFGTALFADAGWAGAREEFVHASGMLRGAGWGIYFLDGLVRLDASRGLERSGRWRGDMFINLR